MQVSTSSHRMTVVWGSREELSLCGPFSFPSLLSPPSFEWQAELARGPRAALPVSSPFSPHSYQHPPPPGHLQWDRRHSEPHVTLPGSLLGLTRRGSEPTYLPSVAVGWDQGMEPGLEGLASQNEELRGSSWQFLLPSCESSGVQQVGTGGI